MQDNSVPWGARLTLASIQYVARPRTFHRCDLHRLFASHQQYALRSPFGFVVTEPPGGASRVVPQTGVWVLASSQGRERDGRMAIVKLVLELLFSFICVFMVIMTVRTSLQVPIWQASFAGNPWAWATLYDVYFGFVTFFCWGPGESAPSLPKSRGLC
jgi:hypothetical protein